MSAETITVESGTTLTIVGGGDRYSEGYDDGYDRGYGIGYQDGESAGYDDGYRDGGRDAKAEADDALIERDITIEGLRAKITELEGGTSAEDDLAEWEKELLGIATGSTPEPAKAKIVKGQRVRIGLRPSSLDADYGYDFTLWDGFEAEAGEDESDYGNVWLTPLSDRPDGFRRAPFCWDAASLTVVEPEPEPEPEPRPFVVGDRVRVLEDDGLFYDNFVPGMTATVIEAAPFYRTSIRVRFEDDATRYAFPHTLELIEAEPEPAFKVGDRVLVSAGARTVDGDAVFFGGVETLATVEGDEPDYDGDLWVRALDGDHAGRAQYVAPKHLTLDPAIRVGDFVKVIDNSGGDTSWVKVGDTGTVTHMDDTCGLRYLTVQLDKGRTTGMFDHRFERIS